MIYNHWIMARAVRSIFNSFNEDFDEFIESFGPDVPLTTEVINNLLCFIKQYESKVTKKVESWKVVYNVTINDEVPFTLVGFAIHFKANEAYRTNCISRNFTNILNPTKEIKL